MIFSNFSSPITNTHLGFGSVHLNSQTNRLNMSNDKEANEVQVTQESENSQGDTDEKKIWEQKALSKGRKEREMKKDKILRNMTIKGV